jgi:hypothetical protein
MQAEAGLSDRCPEGYGHSDDDGDVGDCAASGGDQELAAGLSQEDFFAAGGEDGVAEGWDRPASAAGPSQEDFFGCPGRLGDGCGVAADGALPRQPGRGAPMAADDAVEHSLGSGGRFGDEEAAASPAGGSLVPASQLSQDDFFGSGMDAQRAQHGDEPDVDQLSGCPASQAAPFEDAGAGDAVGSAAYFEYDEDDAFPMSCGQANDL